jgi:hypothetical protein
MSYRNRIVAYQSFRNDITLGRLDVNHEYVAIPLAGAYHVNKDISSYSSPSLYGFIPNMKILGIKPVRLVQPYITYDAEGQKHRVVFSGMFVFNLKGTVKFRIKNFITQLMKKPYDGPTISISRIIVYNNSFPSKSLCFCVTLSHPYNCRIGDIVTMRYNYSHEY